MKHKHDDNWGWMLAVDFFFAGMGGAMIAIAGLFELFIGGGLTSALASFIGAACVGLGALFLILELGSPLQALRVFMNPKAILTFGAWNMTLASCMGFAFGSFALPFVPWAGLFALKKAVAVMGVITGLIVATYPGVLLARHKSRPFWHGPGIVALFLTSSLVTGMAAHLLCNAIFAAPNAMLMGPLGIAASFLLALQLVFWLAYVGVKQNAGNAGEAVAAQRWVDGDLSAGFKAFLLAGTAFPMVLMACADPLFRLPGALLTLAGGLLMRNLAVKGGESRTMIPGEKVFRDRLPKGHEAFLTAWV